MKKIMIAALMILSTSAAFAGDSDVRQYSKPKLMPRLSSS